MAKLPDQTPWQRRQAIRRKRDSQRSYPRECVNATLDEVAASRPVRLWERVQAILALFHGYDIDSTRPAIHYMAMLEEALMPPSIKGLDFDPQTFRAKAIDSVLDRMIERDHIKRDADVEAYPLLQLRRDIFDIGHDRQRTPWGFFLMTFVDGLMLNNSNRINALDEVPRMGAIMAEDDLSALVRLGELSVDDWLEKGGIFHDHAKPEYIFEEIAKGRAAIGETNVPLCSRVYLYGRYLCLRAAKRTDGEFGQRRYYGITRELKMVDSIDPRGDRYRTTFYLKGEPVGHYTYATTRPTPRWVVAKSNNASPQQPVFTMRSFAMEPGFGDEYADALFRAAQTKDISHVPARIANRFASVLERHGKRIKGGGIVMRRCHWFTIAAL